MSMKPKTEEEPTREDEIGTPQQFEDRFSYGDGELELVEGDDEGQDEFEFEDDDSND